MVELLNIDIPHEGKVLDKNRPKLEDWRRFQNAYYRVYNDGDGWVSKLRHLAKRYGMKVDASCGDKALEKLGHRVYRAALNEYEGAHGTFIHDGVANYCADMAARRVKTKAKLAFRAQCKDPNSDTFKAIRAALEKATDLNLNEAKLADMLTVAKMVKVRKVQGADKELLSKFLDCN